MAARSLPLRRGFLATLGTTVPSAAWPGGGGDPPQSPSLRPPHRQRSNGVMASGSGPQVSMWLGPPDSQIRITALRSFPRVRGEAAPYARQRSRSDSDRPASPAKPVWRNHRREPTRIRSDVAGWNGERQATLACSASWWVARNGLVMTALLGDESESGDLESRVAFRYVLPTEAGIGLQDLLQEVRMPQRVIDGVAELRDLVGQEVGVSDWFMVTQERINAFAEVTEDRQWI